MAVMGVQGGCLEFGEGPYEGLEKVEEKLSAEILKGCLELKLNDGKELLTAKKLEVLDAGITRGCYGVKKLLGAEEFSSSKNRAATSLCFSLLAFS